jgi:hypothetical protein
MTQITHSDFKNSLPFLARRPSLLRRLVRRDQIVELFVIIGAILLLWGGGLCNILKGASPGWVETVRSYAVGGGLFRGEKPGSLTMRGS